MAIKQPPGTTIADPAKLTTEIGLALANGGVYAIQTTQDVYVTQVTENTYRQTINTTVNSPGGTTPGEVQFFDGRGFAANSAFKYDTSTDSLQLRGNLNIVGNINLTGALNGAGLLNLGTPAAFTIAGGNPGDVLTTDGAGHMAWLSAAGATYSNANVGAYLPTHTGNVRAGNAALGNLVTANFYAGTLTTPAQPNITSVGTLTTLAVTGTTSTGPLAVAGTIISTGNIQGSNISTTGNIAGLNLTINNIAATGNLTLSRSIVAANVTATHYGDGGNLSNITGANVVGDVAGANHANIADVANSVAGANVTGVVANAAHAVVSNGSLSVPGSGVVGNVNTAIFAYTTDVAYSVDGANVNGNVASAIVSNTANTAIRVSAPVANISITGGTNGQVLSTNGAGVLGWASIITSSITNGTSNISIGATNGPILLNVGGSSVIAVNRISSSIAANWIPQTNGTYTLGNSLYKWQEVFTAVVKMTPQTVTALGSAVTAGTGAKAFVTDSVTNVWGTTAVGGGTFSVPVFSNGAAWIVG